MTTAARVLEIAAHAEVHAAVREAFGRGEAGDAVLRLVAMAPKIDQPWTRLTAAAYRKGLIVGLSHDYRDDDYPDCPYDGLHGNYARGGNDPRDAWRAGSLDGQRIRDIVRHPNRTFVPALMHREYKTLTTAMQDAIDNDHPIGNVTAGVVEEMAARA